MDLSPSANASALEVEWLDELLNSVMHSNNPALVPSLPGPTFQGRPGPRSSDSSHLFIHMAKLRRGARAGVRRSPPPTSHPHAERPNPPTVRTQHGQLHLHSNPAYSFVPTRTHLPLLGPLQSLPNLPCPYLVLPSEYPPPCPASSCP